jgi:hypothetical protein
MHADDLEQLEAGMALYDAFYRWCRDATEETHDWPSRRRGPEMASTTADLALPSRERPDHPSFAEAVRVWARIAALSFGGPPGRSR